MVDRIARTIARHGMFEAGDTVGLAVSGGADSVCLLHVLRELASRWDLRLQVLHVNHHLRGAESDADAEFVRAIASGFGLPFAIREVDLTGCAGNLEQAARQARLAFFAEVIGGGPVRRVATGHTRSDQAETVLFRFLRGAGSAGLAGIRPVTREGIVRPLLEVDRAEVLEFLRRRDISWRDDSTNLSLEFTRNRIRHELLPQLTRDWSPALTQTLAQTAEWALAEEAYWEAEIDRLAPVHLMPGPGCILLKTSALKELPSAAARRLVRRAMGRVKGDLRGIEFVHVQAVLELADSTEGHGRLQAPGLDIMRSFDWLRFGRPTLNGPATRNYGYPAPVPGVIRIPGTELEICLELVEKPETSRTPISGYNNMMVGVDWQRVSGPLELRNWRPGDQYQPRGTVGAEKIKTLFQEFRIPLWERRHWPVLTDGSSIVWTRRFGPAAQFAEEPESPVVLKIREMRVVPEQSGVYNSE
ncbi:MAG: tRNA lysidine(34) synthetase TilS [Acidobacteriia bacterium]|nr:tRNA lysidine(34) synthetase TilS [Terriglobia bacterium]